jgi:hypothetical protein
MQDGFFELTLVYGSLGPSLPPVRVRYQRYVGRSQRVRLVERLANGAQTEHLFDVSRPGACCCCCCLRGETTANVHPPRVTPVLRADVCVTRRCQPVAHSRERSTGMSLIPRTKKNTTNESWLGKRSKDWPYCAARLLGGAKGGSDVKQRATGGACVVRAHCRGRLNRNAATRNCNSDGSEEKRKMSDCIPFGRLKKEGPVVIRKADRPHPARRSSSPLLPSLLLPIQLRV